MEKLEQELKSRIAQLEEGDRILEELDHTSWIYPFNRFEYMLAQLLGRGKLSLDEYDELRKEYMKRNVNLAVFQISAPRGFGEKWAQGHLQELVPQLQKPSKKLDPEYSGEYDFWLDGIKIEVKASRAVDFNSRQPLYMKALTSDSPLPFAMNFQQIKPACSDIFIWVGVWRDVIRYWVLTSHDVENNPYYSTGQHRGNVGEGQLHLRHDNIDEFVPYECTADQLYQRIIQLAEQQKIYQT